MRRPTYETETDRATLEAITVRLQRLFGGKFSPIPAGITHKRFRPEPDGRLEDGWVVKRRRYTSLQLEEMGGYMLAIRKWEAGFQCSRDNDCPFIVALALEDGLFTATFHWKEMRKEQRAFTIKEGGRADRGDPDDFEECIFIPMQRFQREEAQSGGMGKGAHSLPRRG